MKGLVWTGVVALVVAGFYLLNPPRLHDAAAGQSRATGRTPSQSTVVRLAEAGLAMRRQAATPQAFPDACGPEISFGAKIWCEVPE